MPTSSRAARTLLPLLVVAFAALGVSAAPALAASPGYGQITTFGSKGPGSGQLEGSAEGSGIGVDPRNNSVYTVDLPGENEKNEFRLQKFEANSKGEYKVVASVIFKPHNAEREEPDNVEGVAVDPSLNRVYVLANEVRPTGKGLASGDYAAAQLYAFSTEPKSGKLVPAEGTEKKASSRARKSSSRPPKKRPTSSSNRAASPSTRPTTTW